MEPERWRRIMEVFEATVELPVAERRRFVEAACAGDDVLRRTVLGLLEADDATMRSTAGRSVDSSNHR